MATTREKVFGDALGLAEPDRLALIEELWESLPAEAVPLTDAQRAELDRRIAEHEADPDDVVSWDEIKAAAEQRSGK